MTERGTDRALARDLKLDDADGFYQELIEMTKGMTEQEALKVNAKLVLLLANHIGDRQVLSEAMAAARAGVTGGGETP